MNTNSIIFHNKLLLSLKLLILMYKSDRYHLNVKIFLKSNNINYNIIKDPVNSY